MSMPETSGVLKTQPTASVNAVASQQSNVTTPPEVPITQIDEQNGAKAMNGNDYTQKTASILQNTYFFEKDEARQISAFATAVRETDLKDLCPNVKPGFLDKIKALCARILQLFKVDSKSIQLHKDGIAVFDRLKNTLLIPENKDFVLDVIKANGNNKEALKGFARVVGFDPDENLDLSTQLETFINIKYFDNLKNYTGENGKITFLKETLDNLLASENGQEKLKTFFEIFDKNSKYIFVDSHGVLNFECPDIADSFLYSAIFVPYKNNNIDELKNTDKKILLFQALYGIQNMKHSDVDNLEKLIALAKANPNVLMNPKILSEIPELKEFLEKDVLPITKEDIQEALKALEIPQKSSFSQKNPIFSVLAKGFQLTISTEPPIEISLPEGEPLPEGIKSREQWAFKKLQDSISHLPEAQQKRVREFCKNCNEASVLLKARTKHPLILDIDETYHCWKLTSRADGFDFQAKREFEDKEEKLDTFSCENQIFKDLARGFSFTVRARTGVIEVRLPDNEASLPEGLSRDQWAFNILNEQLNQLPEEDRNKVQEFCKTFPTQGVLALKHPRLDNLASINGGEMLDFTLDISGQDFHVITDTRGGKNNQRYCDPTGKHSVTTSIETPPCKFEFDYDSASGSSSNIQVTEYSGQTVKITSGFTSEGETISFNPD